MKSDNKHRRRKYNHIKVRKKQKKAIYPCLFVEPQDYTDYARYMLCTSRYSATATQRTMVLEVVKLRAAKCMAKEKKNYLTLILQLS